MISRILKKNESIICCHGNFGRNERLVGTMDEAAQALH